jgi:YjjG family noncanonical pyrimidine nucleotidase
MRQSSISLVLFDADNTLLDFNASQSWALSQALAQAGLKDNQDVHQIYSHINHRLWAALEQGTLSSADLRHQRFAELLAHFNWPGDASRLSTSYLEFLSQAAHVIPGAIELLSFLQGKVRLALVTNGIQDIQRSRLALSGLDSFFEEIVISEETGTAKPDVEFFDQVFSRLGYTEVTHPRGHQALIVGDSLSSDIQGGINAGINTCWYNPLGVFPGLTEGSGPTPASPPSAEDPGAANPVPTFTVSNISEVAVLPGMPRA